MYQLKSFVVWIVLALGIHSFALAEQPWKTLESNGEIIKRHECSFVEVDGLFYLMGGRRIQPVNIYNPKTNSWSTGAKPPIELHHFQAVAYDDAIWIIGAQTGKYPHETPVPNIYKYIPESDTWIKGDAIPEDAHRAGGGLVVYKNRFFMIGGIIDGHYDGHSDRMDVYDPKTGEWQRLPDAPRVRDHFMSVIIDHKIYCPGGRVTSKKTNEVFSRVVPEVDVYDLKTGEWHTLNEKLPNLRAGCTATSYKDYLIVMCGESSQKMAHNEVDVYNTKTHKWTRLPDLNTGRHGTQVINYKNKLYVASGSGNRGGGPELTDMEYLDLKANF